MLALKRNIRPAVLGLALAVLLAGCAWPAGTSPSQPTSSADESAPEQEEQARETGLTRPALVFDGRCDLVFTDAELASVMGQTLTLDNNHFSELWGGDGLFNQKGGFECTWSGDRARVIALVLPEAAVDYSPRNYECGVSHDTDDLSCPMESVANEIRLSGISTLGQDAAAAVVARDALLAIFAEKAAEQAPVPVPLPAIGSWQVPVPCAAIEGADFSAVPGLGADAADAGPPGYGKDTTQAEQAFNLEGYSPSCVLLGESADVEYVAVGGARWREAGG